jgi:ACT domain-containing protein
LCITHQREREKSVETVSIPLSQERRNEREKTKSGLEKTASKQRKRNERDLREKNESKEEEEKTL